MTVIDGELPDNAKTMLAEKERLGKIPRDEFVNRWNDMIMAIEERNVCKFVSSSERIISLLNVMTGSELLVRKVRSARYCFAKGRLWTTKNFLNQVEKMLEHQGINIVPTVVGYE